MTPQPLPANAAQASLGKLLPNPKARLKDQFHEVARFRHLSPRSEATYWEWVVRFLKFHKARAGAWQHPRDLGIRGVTPFLTWLATERNVSVSTQNQALNGLLFLYREVLALPMVAGDFVRVRRPPGVPTVLTKDEVRELLAQLTGTYLLMARLLYGTGMRLLELLRLRVKDVDFARGQIVVRAGKGGKDRVTMLPESLREPLQKHLAEVRKLHQLDLEEGFGSVSLPSGLARKYPNAEREWGWQFAPFLCHASARIRNGYPQRPEHFGASECGHNADLHPCHAETGHRRLQSRGQHLTFNATLEVGCIGCLSLDSY
jgi:integrase